MVERERLHSGISYATMEQPQPGRLDDGRAASINTSRQVAATSKGLVNKDKTKVSNSCYHQRFILNSSYSPIRTYMYFLFPKDLQEYICIYLEYPNLERENNW